MSNVLSDDKKQQVIALGRLGWSLRRIQETTHIRRETAAGYLRAAGIPVWGARRMGTACAGKTGQEVITDSGAESVPITVPEPPPARSRSAGEP